MYESAVGDMRVLETAIVTYYGEFGDYPPSLSVFGPPAAKASVIT
jgi:hypothetical protein